MWRDIKPDDIKVGLAVRLAYMNGAVYNGATIMRVDDDPIQGRICGRPIPCKEHAPMNIVFSTEISRNMLALINCKHPREKVAGDSCTCCGAVYLRDSGWAQPVLLVALKLAVDGGQRIESR